MSNTSKLVRYLLLCIEHGPPLRVHMLPGRHTEKAAQDDVIKLREQFETLKWERMQDESWQGHEKIEKVVPGRVWGHWGVEVEWKHKYTLLIKKQDVEVTEDDCLLFVPPIPEAPLLIISPAEQAAEQKEKLTNRVKLSVFKQSASSHSSTGWCMMANQALVDEIKRRLASLHVSVVSEEEELSSSD